MNDSGTRDQLVAAIDAWLPQTQCSRCGYPRCLDYARALANGEADLNQCPPGGGTTVQGLADLLGREPKPLDPAYGEPQTKTVVRIDEPRCIGCTLCIQACPVDAIVGAATRMHSVIESECTGCELCLPPCPVDCIDVMPAAPVDDDDSPWPDYSRAQTERARARTRARLERLERRRRQRHLDRRHRRARPGSGRMQTEIAAAVARTRARRRQDPADPS